MSAAIVALLTLGLSASLFGQTSDPAISAVGVAGTPVFSQVTGSYTWAQAKADAVARGGRLAVVNTSTKQAQIQSAGLSGWIGLTDEVTEGVFKWVDGSSVSYSNWLPGLPDGGKTENYVHVYAPSGFIWDDQGASAAKSYILEKFSAVALGGSANLGSTVSLTVTATGSGLLSYQWRRNGVAVSGATSAMYTINPVAESHEGTYDVVVSNGLGSVTSSAVTLSVNDPVVITAQPASQSAFQGMSAGFSVAATGTGPLSYQWKLNGTNIAGANSATYSIAQVAAVHAGTYTCAVSNVVGTVVSSGAVLMVGPAIVTQPSALTVNPGGAASFTVGATGSSPLFYQWLKGGAEIFGATGATYTISPAAEASEGSYSVRVSNALGALTSASAVLSVNDPVVIAQQPVAQSALQGFGAAFTVTATGTGPLTYQWRKDGVNIAGATSATYTAASVTGADAATYTCAVGNAVGTVISNGGALTVGPAISAVGGLVGVAGNPVFSKVTGSYTWVQAKADAVTRGGRLAVVDTSTKQAQIQSAGLYGWIGLTDEVTEGVFKWVDGTSLSYSNWSPGEPNNNGGYGDYGWIYPPSISTSYKWDDLTGTDVLTQYILEKSPAVALDGSVNPGSQVTFTVTATGSGPLSYQWQKDGVLIPGATAATYTIASVAEASEGGYSVRVSNVLGVLTSSPVVLSVNDPVSITAQPVGLTVNPGAPASLTVAATGTGPLSYQWYRNGAAVAGATSASYALSLAAEANEGSYTVVVTNAVGSVTSAAAVLVVNDPVTISVQPASRTANPGTSTTFSVTVAGTAPLAYQWRRNGVPIGGATGSSYVLTPLMEAQEGSYDVVVSNVVGSVTSAGATLTVNDPVVITAQPQSHAAISGVPATFAVAATGTGPLTYQWRRNGVPVGGAVGTSFTLVLPNKADEAVYTCAVTNVAGTVVTNEAQLTVNDFAITTQPVARAVMPGGSASFSVAATGVAGPSYQWRLNGVNIPGATGSTYTIGAVVVADAGVYSCLVTGSGGVASSLGAALTVGPAITVQPVGTTVNAGSQLGLSVSATGSAPFTYQWRRNGVAVVGGTQASYVVASALGADAGSYDVVVSNGAGSVQSGVAVVGVVDPVILSQPGALTVNPGTRATFSVVAVGTGPLSYQWRRNGADIGGANAAGYTIAAVSDAHEGTYSVVVGNGVGSVTSAGAALIVNNAVVISGQPVALGLMPGASASFSVTASGSGTLVYQWKRNGSAIPGANGSVHAIGTVSAAHAGTYTCEVGNMVGAVVSNGAVLSVGPAILSQPQAQTVSSGAMASLSVTAAGDGPLSYQWCRNGVDIEGATSAAYTVAPASKTNAGSYTVVVRNAVGSVTSIPAALSVFQSGTVTFATREIRRLKAPGELAVPVTLRRVGGSDGVATVRVAATGGTLASASYQLPDSPTEVEWADGDAEEKTVILTVRASAAVAAGGDTVVLGLQSPTGVALGELQTCVVSLRPQNSGVLGFAESTLERVKPASGDLWLDVVVSRMQGSTGAVSAEVVVAGGTALAGDYTVDKPVRLEWADGDAADKTFPVVFKVAAAVPAAGKTVQFKLQNLAGGALLGGVDVATLTVRGATQTGTLNFSSATYAKAKAESGDTLVPVTVNRVLGGNGAVSVRVAVTGGTASAVDDYALPESPLILSWGDDEMGPKTFNMVLKEGAQIAGAGETVLLKLQGVTGGAVVGTVASATVTFTSADTTAPVLVIESPANRATITGGSVVFKGKATDVSGVTRVEVTLNDEVPQEAMLMPSANGNAFGWMVTLVPEQGLNTVKVQAFDARGNASLVMTRQFTFLYARPALAGTFDGLFAPATDEAKLAADFPEEPSLGQAFLQTRGEGLFTAVVTGTGSFTGKLTTGGTAVPFKGVLRRDGTAWFDTKTASMEVAKGSGSNRVVLGYLAVRADENGELPRLVGEFTSTDEDGAVVFAELVAEKFVYSAATVLPAGMERVPVDILDPAFENGRYTSLFDARVDAGMETNGGLERGAFPQASGYAKVTVASSGLVSVVGKLADGTVVSYSNRLSPTGTLPVYLPIYTNRGFLAGSVVFDDAQLATDVACVGMRWLRPAGVAAPYAEGWPEGITVDLVGSKYVAPTKATAKVPTPANPYTVFGPELPVTARTTDDVPDYVGLRVGLSGGALATDSSNEAKLTPANVFSVTGVTPDAVGAAGLKLSFTTADGGFTGSFTHSASNKLMPFAGVVLQKTQRAGGFFTFLPTGGVASPAAVGAVDVVVP